MDENTFKIGVNPEATAPASATPPPAPLASSAPQPTSPVINTKLNVQLDKSVDTQLGRLTTSESKLLSTKSYLVIGILIIALATISYGAYVFFFAAESSTEESFEDITLTNKLGGTEDSEETSEETTPPPSLTINLPEEETSAAPADETLDAIDPATASHETETANSKIPR